MAATFPIKFAERLPSGQGPSAPWSFDVSTGQEAIGRGLMQLGAGLAEIEDTIFKRESAAEYSELKRKVDERGFTLFNSTTGDEEQDAKLWENFQTDVNALQSKKPNVTAALQRHINEVIPDWKDSFDKKHLAIRQKNAHDTFISEGESLLAKKDFVGYQTLNQTRLTLNDISQAEFDSLMENMLIDSAFAHSRGLMADGNYVEATKELVTLQGLTPTQKEYRNKLLKNAQPQMKEQQDALSKEAAVLWFDDQLTMDWLIARQGTMARDDFERFVTSLKTDKALRSNNIVKNRLDDMVYDVQRGAISYEEFAKEVEQAATIAYKDNRPAITRDDYDSLLADGRKEFASYQASTMKTSLGEIYDQVVTMKQSLMDNLGTFLSADSEQMINAQNRRQKEEDEYAEISKELKDWFKVNPDAGSEEFYKKKRELLALSKKHTAAEIRTMRDTSTLRKYVQQRSGKEEPDFILNDEGQKVLTQAGAQNLIIETGGDVERAKALAKERGLIDPEL